MFLGGHHSRKGTKKGAIRDTFDQMMSEKEERIKRRRETIQKRRDNAGKVKADNSETTNSVTSPSSGHEHLKSEQQIVESISHLRRRKESLFKELSSIRIDVDSRENSHRIECESRRNDILKQTKEGIDIGNDDIAALSKHDKQDSDDIKETHETMEMIRKKYNAILDNKDIVIEVFKKKLRDHDHDYLETLKKHESIIDNIRDLTMDQISVMQKLRVDELKSIDEAFREDRRALIEEHSINLKTLMEKKESIVVSSLDSIQNRMDEKEKRILQAHDTVSKEYNDLRDKLQEQVTQLEREWSVSRGLYSVSIDQIEYDHREIQSKNTESENRIKKSKKRIVQFKEELNRELDRTRTAEEEDSKKNSSFEMDCRRLEGQYRNLLSKLHRFELLEDQKFSSALSMHKEEAKSLTGRIEQVRNTTIDMFFDQR